LVKEAECCHFIKEFKRGEAACINLGILHMEQFHSSLAEQIDSLSKEIHKGLAAQSITITSWKEEIAI